MEWIALPLKAAYFVFAAAYSALATLTGLVWALLKFIKPAGAGDFWSAVEGLATLLVGYFAWLIARNQFELEVLPVIRAKRQNRVTTLANVGRGVALDVYGVTSNGTAEFLTDSLSEGQPLTINQRLTLLESFSLYYTNAYGKWFRAKLLSSSINGTEPQFTIHAEMTRVGFLRNRLPASVKAKHGFRTRSAQETVRNQSNPLRRQYWNRIVTKYWTPTRLWIGKQWHGLGEVRRHERYGQYRAQPLPPVPASTVVDGWPIDLGTVSQDCWHTSALEIVHYDCQFLADGGFACNVVRQSPWGNIPGLFVVRSASWSALMSTPRPERNLILQAKLVKYLCGRSPRDFFVCVI